MTLQRCPKLGQDGQVFIFPLHQSLDLGSLKRVDLGTVPLQLRQIPKGLTHGNSLLPTIPAARAASPSLTQKLGGTSPCPDY